MAELHTKGFQNPAKVDEALRILLDHVRWHANRTELVPVTDVLGRVLADDIRSRRFLPPVDRSVVDGYAVQSVDIVNASKAEPVELAVAGESKIGEICRLKIEHGAAVAVATGSMIPRGADAVVMIEKTRPVPENRIAVFDPAHAGSNISKKGEDVSPGNLVLTKSRRLRPQDLGIAKALGISKILVQSRPRVGLISTGNELADLATRSDGSKVVDVNRTILSGMLRELGAEPVDFGIAKDNERQVLHSLRRAFRTSDIIIVTAGSSVGRKDVVPECINKLGKPGMLVHGVAMRPSLPTGLAVVKDKPILSLPGFPVSAIIAFRVFARPLIAQFLGIKEFPEPIVRAVLKERVSGPDGYRTFVRVHLRTSPEGLVAEPLGLQRSSVLMSMVAANGIVTIPEDVGEFESGEEVAVAVIGEIEQ